MKADEPLTTDDIEELWELVIESYELCHRPITHLTIKTFADITGWMPTPNGSDSGCDEWRFRRKG